MGLMNLQKVKQHSREPDWTWRHEEEGKAVAISQILSYKPLNVFLKTLWVIDFTVKFPFEKHIKKKHTQKNWEPL